MGPADSLVWKAALERELVVFDRFDYDVRLGGADVDLLDEEGPGREMWATLLQKRVDAVGWKGTAPTIIEVKDVASFAALGQCLGYGFLWRKLRSEGPLKLLCVCARVDSDLRPAFEAFGVGVVVLPPDLAESILARPHYRAWEQSS